MTIFRFSRLRFQLALALLAVGQIYPALGFAQSSVAIELIVDHSASMNKFLQGRSKRETAIASVRQSVRSAPLGSEIAVRVFGHRTEDREKSCQDTELILPFTRAGAAGLLDFNPGLNARGYSALALSLAKAKDDFGKTLARSHRIIVISDGQETCGGDPLLELRKLRRSGFELQVDVAAFDVAAEDKNELMAIAAETGGEYYSIVTQTDLTSVVQTLINKPESVSLPKGDLNSAKDAGQAGANALPISFDQMLKNYIGGSQDVADLFSFDGKVGEKFIVTLKPDPTLGQSVIVRLLDPELSEKQVNLAQSDSGYESELIQLGSTGKYYLEVGLRKSVPEQTKYELELRRLVKF